MDDVPVYIVSFGGNIWKNYVLVDVYKYWIEDDEQIKKKYAFGGLFTIPGK